LILALHDDATSSGGGTDRTKYDYDAADQLLAITDPAAGLVASFAYDAAGRRTAQTFGSEATGFIYDAAGRLVEVERPGYQATLGHDPEGLHYRRVETGEPPALFFGEWVERRGGETVRLTHGPGVDNVVAEVTRAGAIRTLLRNGTANVTHVAVAGALEPAPRRYEAFGGLRSGSSVVERGFAGRPPGATGLINLRARHYDPVTGTFLQVDPLGIEAVQRYAYARQNPYRFWDPSGRDPGELLFGVDSTIHAPGVQLASAGGATMGPQEPAASRASAGAGRSSAPRKGGTKKRRGPRCARPSPRRRLLLRRPPLRRKPRVPAVGIAVTVPDREHDDLLILDPVEDAVREATKLSAPHLAPHDREGTRHAPDAREAGLRRALEDLAPARAVRLVPLVRLDEIASRLWREDQRQCHLGRRRSSSRTSSHGTTRLGSARWAATRRSSSSFCASVSGSTPASRSASAAMLSHSSSTSSSRSAAVSLNSSSRRSLVMTVSLPPTSTCGKPGARALARTIHEARSENADSDGDSRPSDRRTPQAYSTVRRGGRREKVAKIRR